MKVNTPLSLLIKKEMVTQSQNYSFIEQDPLLFNSAKILALEYYIYVDAENNFDYKLLMRFGSSRSKVLNGPIEEGKKWFERARYGEWKGKAFSKKILPLTARGGPIESVDCNNSEFTFVIFYEVYSLYILEFKVKWWSLDSLN